MPIKNSSAKLFNLLGENVGIENLEGGTEVYELDDKTIELIKNNQKPPSIKIINLIKAIQKKALKESGDLLLISLQEKAKIVQDNYEERILTTEEALAKLEALVEEHQKKEKVKREKGFDTMTYFLDSLLEENKIEKHEAIAKEMNDAFIKFQNWRKSEQETRELRESLYFILLSTLEDVDSAYKLIENLFNILIKANENLER